MAGKPLFVAVLLAAALLALSYLIPVVKIAFSKKDFVPAHHGHGEHGSEKEYFDAAPAMLIPLAATTVISIILGCMPDAGLHLYTLAETAAQSITGVILEGGGLIG